MDQEQLFFEQNVALFDARIRSLSNVTVIRPAYVRELYLVNFSDEDWDRTMVGYEEDVFVDDGTGYDLVANDGIFTSTDSYFHTNEIPFDSDHWVRSVLERPIVDENFTHEAQLREFAGNYPIRDNSGTSASGGSIKCKIKTGCTGCIAQKQGWCDACCICIDCNITIRW